LVAEIAIDLMIDPELAVKPFELRIIANAAAGFEAGE
jgi:hypothetical protein